MMNYKFDIKFLLAIALVVLSVASRLLPLPANFSPLMAVALFSGVVFANKKIAFLIPVVAMLISDIIIGLHPTMIAVYVSFSIIVLLGMRMKSVSIANVLGRSVVGAVTFFIITNFAVWVAGWYGYTFAGLITCYEMAIPFFRNTLLSSVLYSGILFGGFYIAEKALLSMNAVKVK